MDVYSLYTQVVCTQPFTFSSSSMAVRLKVLVSFKKLHPNPELWLILTTVLWS